MQGELFDYELPDDDDDDEDEPQDTRSYVDFLDFSLMETTGGSGGEAGIARRAEAVAQAQEAFERSLGRGDICPSCADEPLLF